MPACSAGWEQALTQILGLLSLILLTQAYFCCSAQCPCADSCPPLQPHPLRRSLKTPVEFSQLELRTLPCVIPCPSYFFGTGTMLWSARLFSTGLCCPWLWEGGVKRSTSTREALASLFGNGERQSSRLSGWRGALGGC